MGTALRTASQQLRNPYPLFGFLYNVSGVVTWTPIGVVGAAFGGRLFSCMATDGELVDGREHTDLSLRRDVVVLRVSNAGTTHLAASSTSSACFSRRGREPTPILR